jgi:hypothetical protein
MEVGFLISSNKRLFSRDSRCRLSQRLQPEGNVHALTKHIAIPLHDIAQVDADTDVHLLGYLFVSIVSMELLLDALSALHGVDHRGEFHQKSVTSSLNHVAIVLNHSLSHELVMGFQQSQHAGFIGAHLAAKAHHVGEHDGVQFAGLRYSHLAVASFVGTIILWELASVKEKEGTLYLDPRY